MQIAGLVRLESWHACFHQCAVFRAVPRMVRPERIHDFSFPLPRPELLIKGCFCLSLLLWCALVTVCSWNTGLGMYALVTVCAWNTNGIMLWAWMLLSPYAIGTRASSWFGHGCFGDRMRLEHERNYALSMDALVTVCFRNRNVIMVWAWMLW